MRIGGGLALVALLPLGCGPDRAPDPRYFDLRVRSDLAPGAELLYVSVEVLAEDGDDPVDRAWFRLATDCQRDPSGDAALFSLDIQRGRLGTARLRVSGYTLDERGAAALDLRQNLEVDFGAKPGVALVELNRRCRSGSVHCVAGETCDPRTGACGPAERIRALEDLDSAPRVLACAAQIEPPAVSDIWERCRTGDEKCPEGCSARDDRDCRDANGAACVRNDDCRTDLVCAQGVCCDALCDDPCSSCAEPGLEGYCSAIDYTASNDPRHCGACGAVCSDEHASDSACAAGRCAPTCKGDYGDCDGELAGSNGCETHLDDDADHCGVCGRSCLDVTGFPYCAAQRCAQGLGNGVATDFDPQDGYTLPARWTTGTKVTLEAGRVFALGALLDPVDPKNPGEVVFALIPQTPQGYPGEFTGESSVEARAQVQNAAQRDARGLPRLTVQELTDGPHDLGPGDYWFLIKATAPLGIRLAATEQVQYLLAEPDPAPELTFVGMRHPGSLILDPLPRAMSAIVVMTVSD